MRHIYRLVGYDRRTERLAQRYDIPPAKAKKAKDLVGLEPDDIGDMPLTDPQARSIAAMIGAEIDIDRFEYFLEPYAPADEHRKSMA
jgi:hypothetical protein